MKKITALVFSAAVLVSVFTGCGEAAESAELAEEITVSVSDVVEAAVTFSETLETTLEETSDTISERSLTTSETGSETAEITTAAISETSLTASETEAVTEVTTTAESAEKAAETKSGGTYAADKDSLVGTWYAIDSESYEEMTYTFSEDGTITASDASKKESGTYTVNNGLLELTLSYEGEDYIQSIAAVVDGDVLVLDLIGLNTELIREEFVPYTEDRTLYDYCHDIGSTTVPLFLSREKSVLAEQKDVLGEWTVFEKGEAAGKCVFDENSITEIRNGKEETLPIMLKNGRTAFSGEAPENVSLSEDIVSYLCGGKIYTFDAIFPTIMEKIK
ncbi:MAG: DUF5640 domain-containing protein [Oscillospiraceae bacterium]